MLRPPRFADFAVAETCLFLRRFCRSNWDNNHVAWKAFWMVCFLRAACAFQVSAARPGSARQAITPLLPELECVCGGGGVSALTGCGRKDCRHSRTVQASMCKGFANFCANQGAHLRMNIYIQAKASRSLRAQPPLCEPTQLSRTLANSRQAIGEPVRTHFYISTVPVKY